MDHLVQVAAAWRAGTIAPVCLRQTCCSCCHRWSLVDAKKSCEAVPEQELEQHDDLGFSNLRDVSCSSLVIKVQAFYQ